MSQPSNYRRKETAVKYIFRKRFTWIFTLALAALLMIPLAAFADQVVNNIDSSIDNALETATITAGGSATVGLFISVSNGTPSGDPTGCNANGANPAAVTLSVPAGVTASTTSLNFTGCGVVQNVTFSSNTVNVSGYAISVSGVTGGRSGSLWDATPASFKLIVNPAPPSDTTPPDITPSIVGTLGANGWYTSDVTVSWVVNDGQSAVSSTAGCSPTTVSSDTAGVTFTCTAMSIGGTSTTPVTIKLDKTAPLATLAVTAGTAGLNSWYTSDVTASTSGSDSISGPVTCTADQSQTTDTTGTEFNGTCTNDAGLSTNAAPLLIKRDSTPPTTPVISGVSNYYFGGTPNAASCTASDVTSGLASCTVGGYGASAVGTYVATATATDNAGNAAAATASYSILGWTLKGFYQPIDMGNVVNTVKNGSTVPMKFEVFAGSTELSDVSAIKSTTYKAISCSTLPVDDIEVTTTGSTSLRYDTTSGQFIFNWQTPKTVGACLRVTMTTQDGSSIFADFKLK
jgi:hypothetical protein